MNIIVAAINLVSAVYWLVNYDLNGVAFSLFGVLCSVVADRWLREYR